MGFRRSVAAVMAVLFAFCFCGAGGVVRGQPVANVEDSRIRELVDAGVLRGAPGGDLELGRTIQGGEMVALIDRVLQMPPVSPQHLGTGTDPGTGDSPGWIRVYVYWRSVTRWFERAGARTRQMWFNLRYRRTADQPWGLSRTHWMSASLRDAYLNHGLVDLSFEPMHTIDGGAAVDLILAAAGYGSEIGTAREQMPEATRTEVRRFVCAQHGMEPLMEYAEERLTRGDAALMVWLLMQQHLAKD